MNTQELTEKASKTSTEPQAIVATEANTAGATAKELTDEQFAAVVGGIQGAHIGYQVAKKM